MPRETFFNLPADKRERLVEAAVDELVANPYDAASISRIVAAADIAKGSFYQYFDDKLDLFGWLIEESGRRRAAAMASLPADPQTDPFARLRLAYREGLRAWRSDPRWTRVGLRLLEPSQDPRFAAMRARHEALVHGFLLGVLRQGQVDGHVRPDLDLDAAAWLASGLLQEGLMRAFFGRLHTTVDRWAEDAAQVDEVQLQRAISVAELAVDLLQAAVGAPRADEARQGP